MRKIILPWFLPTHAEIPKIATRNVSIGGGRPALIEGGGILEKRTLRTPEEVSFVSIGTFDSPTFSINAILNRFYLTHRVISWVKYFPSQ